MIPAIKSLKTGGKRIKKPSAIEMIFEKGEISKKNFRPKNSILKRSPSAKNSKTAPEENPLFSTVMLITSKEKKVKKSKITAARLIAKVRIKLFKTKKRLLFY